MTPEQYAYEAAVARLWPDAKADLHRVFEGTRSPSPAAEARTC